MNVSIRHMNRLFRGSIAGLVIAALAGCDQMGGSTKTSSDGNKASESRQDSTPLGGSKAETPPSQRPAVTAQVSDTSHKPAPAKTPPPAQAKTDPPISETMSPGMESSTLGPSDEERRAQAEDMIYATIRVKMEEMIAQRAKLLKEGKAPSDEAIRALEGSIMRARDLLTEAGEVVEDVQPPIVQIVPRK